METALQVERKIPTRLAVSNKFRGFGPEPERILKKFKVESNQAIERIREMWLRCIPGPREIGARYASILDGIKDLEYSAGDVGSFSILLSEFRDERYFRTTAGLFLSALINNCKDDGFTVHTAHFTEPIFFIGYRNTKNMTVDGDAGSLLGENMLGGSITVEGAAEDLVGELMEEGSITVKGDAGEHVGINMKGGVITVEGNAKKAVGWDMAGGKIVVHGNAGYKVGCGMKGGVITVRGDADDEVGIYMAGGSITVGNAGNRVGWDMRGGTILVKGDAGIAVGLVMKGGEIHIEGNYGSIADDKSGKIFHKEEQIYPK